MEVKFRPLQSSSLTRRVSPGQLPPEGGQSFIEVVESLTGTENNPEENANSGRRQEVFLRKPPLSAGYAADEQYVEEAPETGLDKSTSPPADKNTPEPKPLGIRIDMTA
jgi:hypothetical protein